MLSVRGKYNCLRLVSKSIYSQTIDKCKEDTENPPADWQSDSAHCSKYGLFTRSYFPYVCPNLPVLIFQIV